ncbi:MAG: hypothetical protein M3R65_09315 [Gemmatimonadota bacterium]|nr:hypothetical protein [Gemmatimonadota bacterium]
MRYVPVILSILALSAATDSPSSGVRPSGLVGSVPARAQRASRVAHAPSQDTVTDSVRIAVLTEVVSFRRGWLGDTLRVDPCSLQRTARIDSAQVATVFKVVEKAIAPWETCKPGPHHYRPASAIHIDSVTETGRTIEVWTGLVNTMYSRREKYELLVSPVFGPNITRIVQSYFSIADPMPPPRMR